MWQTDPEEGVAEPAILIENYSDTIALTQNGSVINLNYESVDEFCKHLRKLLKNRK